MIVTALALLAVAPAHKPADTPNRAVIAAVKANLNDPDSAKIRNIKATGPGSYCGWVNAKNAFGGYAGDQLFYDDAGFVQIFDLETAFDQSDLAAQGAAFASGDTEHALQMKPKLSAAGKKVEPCLKDYHGN